AHVTSVVAEKGRNVMCSVVDWGYGVRPSPMSDCIELDPMPESVATARRWSVDFADRVGLESVSETVALLVSEQVTNAVVNAGTSCQLHMRSEDGGVRVEVRDGSDLPPHWAADPDPLSTSGRGLPMVDALADASGVKPRSGGGKTMWFQLDRPGDAPG